MKKHREWVENNKEAMNEYNRNYYNDHEDYKLRQKELGRISERERMKDPKWRAYRTAIANKRRAVKLQAMVEWADDDAILVLYEQAKELENETGIPHHVDHIIPLQGRLVCGLHCEDNLQILTATENLEKGNRLPT